MIDVVRTITVDCVVVLGGMAALAALILVGRVVLDALPVSRARRAWLARVRPLVGLALVAAYAVFAVRWLLATGDRGEWIAFAVVAGVAVAGSWPLLHDLLAGVYMRVGRNFEPGDRVEVAGLHGRVHRLGMRAVVLETTDGQLAMVPYRILASAIVRREPFGPQAAFHVFRAPMPERSSIPEVKRAIREAVLLCHWASTRRLPQVTTTDGGELEITVFPVDANHAPEIERVVRRALA